MDIIKQREREYHQNKEPVLSVKHDNTHDTDDACDGEADPDYYNVWIMFCNVPTQGTRLFSSMNSFVCL